MKIRVKTASICFFTQYDIHFNSRVVYNSYFYGKVLDKSFRLVRI